MPVGLGGDVQMHVDGLSPARPDGGLDLLTLRIEDVPEDDLGTLPGERLRLRRALAARTATDQRDLPIQLSHGPLPRWPPMPAQLIIRRRRAR